MTLLTRPPEWMTEALCANVDPDGMYPDRESTAAVAAAVQLCEQCPVRLQCLRHALDLEADVATQSRHGVWGGLTPKQRALLVSKRNRKKAAA